MLEPTREIGFRVIVNLAYGSEYQHYAKNLQTVDLNWKIKSQDPLPKVQFVEFVLVSPLTPRRFVSIIFPIDIGYNYTNF